MECLGIVCTVAMYVVFFLSLSLALSVCCVFVLIYANCIFVFNRLLPLMLSPSPCRKFRYQKQIGKGKYVWVPDCRNHTDF